MMRSNVRGGRVKFTKKKVGCSSGKILSSIFHFPLLLTVLRRCFFGDSDVKVSTTTGGILGELRIINGAGGVVQK